MTCPSRFGFLRATAHAKLLNLASNYAAILAFVIGGEVYWTIAVLVALLVKIVFFS